MIYKAGDKPALACGPQFTSPVSEDGVRTGLPQPSDRGLLFTSLAAPCGLCDMDPSGAPILVSPISQRDTWNWENCSELPSTYLPASCESAGWAGEGL